MMARQTLNSRDLPFLPGGHILETLLQELPVAIKLLGCLVEVSAVRC